LKATAFSGGSFTVLSEFRGRLILGSSEMLLLNRLLERCQELELIKIRGKQRTDATYILGAVRELTRLEQIGESLRATLNEIATLAPHWLQSWVPVEWYEQYERRIEHERLPKSKKEQQKYAVRVAADGYRLLEAIEQDPAHNWLANLPKIIHLTTILKRHFTQTSAGLTYKSKTEVSSLTPEAESPYDPEARYRRRNQNTWVGYQAHLTETCDDDYPHLITSVATSSASEYETTQTPLIHDRLADLELLPAEHFVDAAYISAEILLAAQEKYSIRVIGPPRQDGSWQAKTDSAFDYTAFEIDWHKEQVLCPNGKISSYWKEVDTDSDTRSPGIKVRFNKHDCGVCSVRARCTRGKGGRQMRLPSQDLYETNAAMRTYMNSEEGKELYKKRAGIEGTISQAVRSFGFRQTRYIGQAKTHLQHVATAAALNLDRLADWFLGVKRAETRVSAFAALAPT
jgi:transposase